jgi:hypothetical protein
MCSFMGHQPHQRRFLDMFFYKKFVVMEYATMMDFMRGIKKWIYHAHNKTKQVDCMPIGRSSISSRLSWLHWEVQFQNAFTAGSSSKLECGAVGREASGDNRLRLHPLQKLKQHSRSSLSRSAYYTVMCVWIMGLSQLPPEWVYY